MGNEVFVFEVKRLDVYEGGLCPTLDILQLDNNDDDEYGGGENAHLLKVPAAHSHTEADGGAAVRVGAGARYLRPLGFQPLLLGKDFASWSGK